MCLDAILDIPEQYKSGEHTGYKIFSDYYDTYYAKSMFGYSKPVYVSPLFSQPFTIDEWVCDHSNQDILSGLVFTRHAKTYPSGFHIFLNKEDAIDWSRYFGFSRYTHHIAEVLFKDVVAYGYSTITRRGISLQNRYATIVAKQIFLPSNKIEVLNGYFSIY